MDPEKRKVLSSLILPAAFVVLIWLIKLLEISFHWNLGTLGIYPLHWKGLIGIVTAPLIHENWSHLMANSGPLLVLGGVIFYFYRSIAIKVFLLIYVMTGLWVWVMAREAYHIGASGVVYGLASFVFTSGVLRRDNRLLALSMLIVFLYGGLVWGVFPELFPEKNISWESHLMGLVAGVVTAFFYRQTGPPKKMYEWETQPEEELPDWYPEDQPPGDNAEPQPHPPDQPPPTVNYIYKENREKESQG